MEMMYDAVFRVMTHTHIYSLAWKITLSLTVCMHPQTPVLLGVKDRAELATDEYIAVSNVLEGVVILKPNPEFEAGAEHKSK